MNYVKLNLGGKEREARFGIGFLQHLQNNEGIKLSDLGAKFKDGDNVVLETPKLIFRSLEFGSIRLGETPDFNYYDVLDWIDEDGGFSSPSITNFIKSFTESLTTNLGKNQPQNQEAKPKKK